MANFFSMAVNSLVLVNPTAAPTVGLIPTPALLATKK